MFLILGIFVFLFLVAIGEIIGFLLKE